MKKALRLQHEDENNANKRVIQKHRLIDQCLVIITCIVIQGNNSKMKHNEGMRRMERHLGTVAILRMINCRVRKANGSCGNNAKALPFAICTWNKCIGSSSKD